MSSSHVVVQWTIVEGSGVSAYDVDFEVYDFEDNFEFVIDMGNDGFAHVVVNAEKTRTLAERLLLRLDNK